MQTEIAEQAAPSTGSQLATVVSDVATDIHLVAQNAEEMKAATTSMAEWFRQKEAISLKDATELSDAVDIATKQGWATDAIKRQAKVARERSKFYEKCRLAAEAGYCVIPNIPASLFAVRTSRPYPRGSGDFEGELTQRSESPPAGTGEYHDTRPISKTRSRRGSEPDKRIEFLIAESWNEVEFPISIAKPQVMTAAAQAMALKVFDEMAICVGSSDSLLERPQSSSRNSKGDPLLLGIIRKPNRSAYFDLRITFLIAWDLDTSAI